MRREKSNYIIQSVAHALDVLEQFSGDADERGVIEQNRATENYRLGVRCLQLGQSYVLHLGLLRQAGPIMQELVRQVRETAYVAVLRRGVLVPVQVVEADRAVRIASPLGEPLPLHCTAAGKAFL